MGPLAALARDFFSTTPICPDEVDTPKNHSELPGIPEHNFGWKRKRHTHNDCRQLRRQRPPRGRTQLVTPPSASADVDDLDYLREPAAKENGYYAGLRRARSAHCAFKELMLVLDGAGATHYCTLHTVRGMPRPIQRKAREPKWPSQASLRRQRAWE